MYWITLLFLLGNIMLFEYIPSAAERLRPNYGEKITVVGRVEPLTLKDREQGKSFILKCEEVDFGGTKLASSDRLRVFVKDSKEIKGQVEVKGILKGLEGNYNPGTFDVDKWNKVNCLGGRISQASIKIKDEKLTLREKLEYMNLKLREILSAKLEKRQAAIMGGMLLGGSNGLEETDRELFSNQGMAHLLSVSGAHLILWSSLLEKLLGFMARKKRRCLILLVLGIYVVLCGARPPVLRAWLMSGLLLWGDKGGKQGYLLCLVAMLLLTLNPLWLQDIGFQLSFGATAGLIMFLPKCQELWKNLLPGVIDFLAESLGVTLAAQLLVVPIEIAYFHQVSLISFITNLLLVPVLELVNIITAIGLVLGGLTDWFGILKLAGWLLEQVLYQSELLAKLPYVTMVVGAMPIWTFIIYYGLLGCWADLGWFKLLSNKERRLTLSALSFLLVFSYGYSHWLPGPLTAYFLDVGQGDGAVILTPRKKVIVVDTGGLKGLDTGSRIVAPVLKYLGKSKVDLLVVSHADQDHIGGGAGLARNIRIERLLLPQESFSEGGAERINKILKYAPNCKVEYAERNKIYDVEGVSVRVVDVPNGRAMGNEASTVLEIRDARSEKKILFTGDMSWEREQDIQNLSEYDILKVAHHGSQYSSSEKFLKQVKPQLAVISCGKDNSYGHPHKETLGRLKAVSCKVLRTDVEGCIIVKLSEKGLLTKGWKLINQVK